MTFFNILYEQEIIGSIVKTLYHFYLFLGFQGLKKNLLK